METTIISFLNQYFENYILFETMNSVNIYFKNVDIFDFQYFIDIQRFGYKIEIDKNVLKIVVNGNFLKLTAIQTFDINPRYIIENKYKNFENVELIGFYRKDVLYSYKYYTHHYISNFVKKIQQYGNIDCILGYYNFFDINYDNIKYSNICYEIHVGLNVLYNYILDYENHKNNNNINNLSNLMNQVSI